MTNPTDIKKELKKANSSIGRRIEERRIAMGVSQAELAMGLGIAPQQFQKYETGANRISAASLGFVADVLYEDIEYFVKGGSEEIGPKKDISKKNILMMRNYNNCSPQDRLAIGQLVKILSKKSKSAN